jgi:hypothetical protein
MRELDIQFSRPIQPFCSMSRYLSFSILWVLLFVMSIGTAQAKEGAVASVTMKLVDADGALIAATETDKDGTWHFEIPRAGTYAIIVDEAEYEEAREAIAEAVPGAEFYTPSSQVARVSTGGRLVTIGWSMKDIAWIRCYESKRDPATGLAIGEKKYKAVQFIRAFDAAVATLECTQGGKASGTLSYTVR